LAILSGRLRQGDAKVKARAVKQPRRVVEMKEQDIRSIFER
jgi:hypothetical protein